MFGYTFHELLFLMAVVIFAAGFITFWVGVIVLVRRSANRELNAIASQTAQIAQKGITDGITGLIGNTSSLITALNQLVHAQNGVGSFLVVVGLILIIAAASLAFYFTNKPV
jgi:hypothetical protein